MILGLGPMRDGNVPVILQVTRKIDFFVDEKERLRQLGSWLQINGEAIYSTTPWKWQNDTAAEDVWYTTNGDDIGNIL